MYLCENLNLTIGIFLIVNNLSFIHHNRGCGLIGKLFQELIDTRKTKPNLCKLIGEHDLGSPKLSNGSYYGAMKRIQNKEMDIYLKFSSAFVDTNVVDLTPTVYTENFLIMHSIETKSNFNDRDVFLNFFDLNYQIWISITLLTYFLIVSIITILVYGKIDKIPVIIRSILRLDRKKSNWLIILSISYVFFALIIERIFLLNMKTSKVIVDTREFLLNEVQIFKSKLHIIWLQGEQEKYLASTAAKNTFLSRLYEYKNLNPPIVVDKRNTLLGINNFEKGFLFLNQMGIRVTAFYFNVFLNKKLFVNENPFYSTPFYFYRIKEKNLKTKLIDQSVTNFYEHGLYDKFTRDINNLKFIQNKGKNKVYYSIGDYTKDHTIFEAITFNNLYYLFAIYLIIINIILIVYIIHYLIKFLHKNRLIIYRAINYVKCLILFPIVKMIRILNNYLSILINKILPIIF